MAGYGGHDVRLYWCVCYVEVNYSGRWQHDMRSRYEIR